MATTGGFPVAYTTTTTTTTTKVNVALRFDPTYVRTIPGILKCIQEVLNLLGFITVMMSSYYYSRVNWFSFVAMTGFWVTGILLLFYLFHFIEKMHFVPWMLGEMIFCAVWTLFYLIAASLCAAGSGASEALGVAAFFGFSAMVAYAYDGFLKYKGWQNGDIAQGERNRQTTSASTVTSPTAY